MIALSMPGKIGDALGSWPLARWLASTRNTKVAFVTSEYCRPLERLCRYQSWASDFIVPPTYVEESQGQGIQPVDMPIPEGVYEEIFQCGFRTVPNSTMHTWIAAQQGVYVPLDIIFDYPADYVCPPSPYIAVAPRGGTSFWEVLAEFAKRSKIPIVEIGGKNDAVCEGSIDLTGLDFLETAAVIAHAHAFVGLLSSQWVLSAGFSIPRIGIHDNKSWNTGVGPQTPYNLYPGNPTPDTLLRMTEFLSPASRCYHLEDMTRLVGEANSVDEMAGHLGGTLAPCHPGRRWEYALAMQVMKRVGVKTVLDVGGAGSVLPALVAASPMPRDLSVRIGADVTIVDPCVDGNGVGWVAEQEKRVGKPLHLHVGDFMPYICDSKFDAVCCLSTLEYIQDDTAFFKKLLSYVAPGGVLILTGSYYPNAQPTVPGHLRTYNREQLTELLAVGRERGFEPFDGEPHWAYWGHMVDQYTLCSLVLQRKS